MIDLSFLTDEEQEAIFQVLQRDADLKKVEEERVRHLPEKIKDDGQLKNMSGQWFYEAKSKRHREKIHGADIIRASMRRKPLTTELSQRKSDKKKNSWVNNVNKEIPTPSDLLKEKEGEPKSIPSSVIFSANSKTLEKPQDDTRKPSVSPSKERKNPFNDSGVSDDHAKSEKPENGTEDLSESREKDPHSPSVDSPSRVNLTNRNRVHESEQAPVEPNELQRQAGRPPVPKARRNVHKTSDVSLKGDESTPKAPGRIKQANGHGTPPRGILKRSSSSSSTDSEVLRLSQNLDLPSKSGLPASTILEGVAEKDSSPLGEPEGFSQNSLERLKQVRFSSVSAKGRLPSLEMHEGKESGEFNLLDSDYSKSHVHGVGDSGGPQKRQALPEKPPRPHLLILNSAAEDTGAPQESQTAPCSCGGNGTADLQPDTLQPTEGPLVEPLPSNESSAKTPPKAAEDQIAERPPQSKADQSSPESEAISESITGRQFPLAKVEEPQARKVGSADLEQGKPALVEGQRAKIVSKPDKHAAEIEKAADESISKVLDWFKRTSNTVGKGGVLLSPLEETDTLKATEDNEWGPRALNLGSPARERKEPTDKEYPFHEQPEVPSFVKNEGPSSLLVGAQPSGRQNRRQDPAGSVDDGQILPASLSTQLQIVDCGVNKTGETAVGANSQAEDEHPSVGEQKTFENNEPRLALNSTDSYFAQREKTAAEQDLKLVLPEGRVEPQSGGSFEEPKSSGTGEKMRFTNRGNPDLQDQEIKQSSSRETKKRVKDIKALWEREETNNLGNKRDLLNKNTSTSKTMLNSNKESQRVRPVGGSSGYVTAESDSEQGKCNLVTFRKVILNEDESEPDDHGLKSSFGTTTPQLIENSKQSYPVERPGKIFSSGQKKAEFIECPDGENFRPRPSTKEGGYLQPVVLQKERTASAVQRKTHFKVHSLKEQLDEDAKAQMLSPSQFQSLRSFWDVGAKPQSGSDDYKAAVTVPRSGNGRAGNNKKEAETRVSPIVLEGAQEKEIFQEVKVDKPNTKHSTQNLLETSRVISAGPPVGSPSVDAPPKGSIEFVLVKDHYLEGKAMLPVDEYIERTEVPSRGQLRAFNSGFQKLLIEISQASLLEVSPADEKGVPSLGLAVQEQMPLDDQDHHQQKVAPEGGQVEISVSDVAEAVNRTLAPPKAGIGALDEGSEKQPTEAADAKTSPKHSVADDVSGEAIPPSERKRFFNKVMERSHDSYPSCHIKGTAGPEEAEDTLNKHASSRDHQAKVKTSIESLSKPTEEYHSIPGKSPEMEEGCRHLKDRASLQDVFQIPSVKLAQSNAGLAAQSKANSAATEVSETVTEVNVPSKKLCSDMNAKIACLLNASSTLPCVLPTTENALKTHITDTLGERPHGSFFAGPVVPASPQRVGSLRETPSESTEGSPKANEECGSVLTTAENEPGEEATGMFSFRSQKILKDEGDTVYGDEQPKDVTETVVKTLKANSYEPASFRASLRKFLIENSEVTEVSKPTQMPLETIQNASSIYDRLAPHLPEIIETVEKTTLLSSPRQVGLKASFQKLLEEESEILPASQESRANLNSIQIEIKSNRSGDLFDQQETGREMNETESPSKEKEAEVNSSLQKLLDDATWMHSIQLASLDQPESVGECPQETKEIVTKSTAPAKDDAMFASVLRKLIRESPDTSLQVSMEDDLRVTDNSTSPLKKQSCPVKMLSSASSASSEFRTEVKIPLKGKTSKQDGQTEEGVPERTAVFQKTIQVITSPFEAAHLDRGEDSPVCSKTGERKRGYDREGEAEVTTASLRDVNEAVDIVPGPQRSSTSCAEEESPLRVSKVELHLGTQKVDEKDNEEGEEGDARSFGSDLSDKNTSSFVRIQRNRTRSEEEPSPVMEALKRSSDRQIPSKSLEDIPSATSNQGKLILPKEDYMLSAEDDQKADQPDEKRKNVPGISTAPSFPDSQFSRPEKVKQMSKSVPAFVQEESDGRETDSASDSSYPLGRIKKSPSSLTNLSGSSGLASLSSVSTSVMSVYSGDFGNVDVKGNIQFAIDYVEQLKELHIFIAQGKDLAIADVKKQRSDPYVKSYLLPEKHKLGKRKTSVKKKTLNPVFNEILRYKVDKELLATQRLNISVWHNDIFGRNSFLGEVELDLGSWDWNDKQNKQMIWYPLKPRTPLASLEAENRGEIKIALQYVPQPAGGKKTPATGEVHIWVKECNDLPILRSNKLNSFVKCTILPDTSRKSRQKTRAVAKTTNPVFNHTMVYDGFRPEDLKEACVELTVWDHNKLANHFLGGLRIGLGTGKSYGTPVDWMDSTFDEINLWERMINSPNTWVEDTLPLRMLTVVKMAK